MQVSYRTFFFPEGAMNWRTSERLLEDNGVGYGRDITILIDGNLEASNTNACFTASNLCRQTLRLPGGDLLLWHGGAVKEALLSAGSLVPVRCINGPNFTGGTPADLTSYRAVNAVFNAVYPPATTGPIIIELSRSVRRSGGGPLRLLQPCVAGSPQLQIPIAVMPYQLVQSGYARSRGAPAPFPPLLLPRSMLQTEPDTVITDRITASGVEYTVQWQYVFQSVTRI